MKIVSNELKIALKQPTTQRKGRILVNGNYYEVYNVEYYADAYNEGNVIGNAIASQLDFDLPYMDKFETFKYYDGVWTGAEYEYVDMGTFTVFDEQDEDEFNKHITAFDNLIKFNQPFQDVGGYPKTLYQELENICSQAEVELQNASIPNGNFIVENNQFVEGENLKTVLKAIEQISGTYGIIKNDNLVLQLKNQTTEEITKNEHEPITWKRRSYGINQVILGMEDVQGEYVLRQDDEDIAINGVHKLVINDNPFVYTQQKREEVIDELFNQVKGFGYVPYDLKMEWLNYMDIGDTITIDGVETLILRMYGKSPKSLESEISAPAIIDSAIEYSNNTFSLSKRVSRTEFGVDKNAREIQAIVETTETIEKEINPTKDESGSEIMIEDGSNRPLNYLEIEGKSTQETRSGKNKFDINGTHIDYNATSSITNDTLKIITSGNYARTDYLNIEIPKTAHTISFDWESDTSLSGTDARIYIYNGATVGTLLTYSNLVGVSGKVSLTFTNTTGAISIRFSPNNTATSKTITMDFNNIQIEEGTTVTEYEAYGISPSPDHPSEIESLGFKNLFDSEDWYNKMRNVKPTSMEKIVIDGFEYLKVSPDTIYLQQYMKGQFKENTQYTINCKARKYTNATNVSTGFCFHYTDGTEQISYVDATLEEYEYVVTSEKGKTIEYIFLSFYYNNAVLMRDITMTEGDNPKKYLIEVETTNGTDVNTLSIVLNQPLRSLPNGTKDIAYIRNNKLYVDRKVGSVVLNGSEDWYTYSNGFQYCYYCDLSGKKIGLQTSICSHFKNVNFAWEINVGKNGYYSDHTTLNRLYFATTEHSTVDEFKTWLSTHNTQVDYELAEPYTEELGEIETLTIFKGYNEITTTDDLQPTLNIQYIRDTIIANYVENHVTELKLNEEQIRQSVETVSSSVDGLTTDISRVEQITTDTSQVLNIISTNIDKSTGEVREVTTTTGFTFNAEGSSIKDSDGFEVLQTPKGAYYKDNGTITGQYTKDGSKQKDLELFGTYSYGKTDIDDTPMFVGQLYTDENGEETFGHFYNGGDY